MSETIPANIYQRIKDWVEQHKTGQITLNLNDGRILKAKLEETVTAQ